MGAMCSGERSKADDTKSPSHQQCIGSNTWGRHNPQAVKHSGSDGLLVAPEYTYNSCQPVLNYFSNTKFETDLFIKETSGFKLKKKKKTQKESIKAK